MAEQTTTTSLLGLARCHDPLGTRFNRSASQ